MPDQISAPTPAPLVVDAKALAQMLGKSLRTIRKLDSSGILPAPIRIGGSVVWAIEEIRDWIAAGAPARKNWNALRATRK